MRSPRHLASPAEIMAALREGTEGPGGLTFEARQWPELQLVEMSFLAPGSCLVAPVGFYAVATFTGRSSHLSEEADGYRRGVHLPEGATLTRRPGAGARYVWTAPHRARMTCLAPEVVTRAAEELGSATPDDPAIVTSSDTRDEVLEHLVAALAEEARLAPHFAQAVMVQSLASAMASRLLSRHSTSELRADRRPGSLGGPAFRRVRAFIEDHVGQHVSLDELAAVAGVSRFHFARQFRLRTGESPMGYLLRARVERAKTMLKGGAATVGEVAAALGFADQSHFSRTFRKLAGVSPSGYASFHRQRGRCVRGDDPGAAAASPA